MKKARVWLTFGAVIIIVVGLVLGGCAKPAPPEAPTAPPEAPTAPPEEPIVLKALRPWPMISTDLVPYQNFLNRVNERGKGRLEIQDIGGSEVYHEFEQCAPLQLGTVDMLITCNGYIAGDFPEPLVLSYASGANPAEMRAGGLLKVLDDIGREEYGVTILGVPYYASLNIWLAEPIKTLDDLKGMKLRSIPVFDPLLKGLGIPSATIPFGDIYTALERGTVDGICFPYYDISVFGWDEVLGYRVDPPLWRNADDILLMNAKSFDALPADLQKLLTDAAIEAEEEAIIVFDKLAAEEWQALKAEGFESIRITDEEWWEAKRIEWEEGIPALLLEASPKHGEELIKLLAQFYPPKEPFPVID